VVEAKNLGASWYRSDQVGRPKVFALLENLKGHFGEVAASGHFASFTGLPFQGQVLVSAVDTVECRKAILEALLQALEHDEAPELYMDCRTGGAQQCVYTLDLRNPSPQDIDRYRHILDKRPMPLQCGARAVSFSGFACAAEVSAIVAAFARGSVVPFKRKFCRASWQVWASGVTPS
jgi:hypothetical protein